MVKKFALEKGKNIFQMLAEIGCEPCFSDIRQFLIEENYNFMS